MMDYYDLAVLGEKHVHSGCDCSYGVIKEAFDLLERRGLFESIVVIDITDVENLR